MPFDPTERSRVGRTAVTVTRLGFGGAPIGGLFSAVSDGDAVATVRRAWELGIRYFDTAPLYGYGASERRIGASLAGRPRDDFTISTKVGRLIRPSDALSGDADIDRQELDGREDAFYVGTGPVRPVFDYSYDGVLRSVEESLERLGLERVDIAFIHDPDDHWEAAIGGAYPALDRLRRDGVVRAIGAGMNQSAMLARFAREGDFDVFLLAGRYTLLDQSALADLLPICEEKRYRGRRRRGHEQRDPRRPAAGQPLRLRAGGDGRRRAGRHASPPSAPGMASRSRPPPSSSRSPIRPSSRSSRASGASTTSRSTRCS